ncbi:MAG: nickel-dependent lactate racemase [Gammaproteobacteria bacterium]|nr:nickel-dependent lactate racemase [Gammaproteobacteria bacterium]
MQDIELAYGTTGLRLTLPEQAEATVIRKQPLPVPGDAGSVIEQALANPIEAEALEMAARNAASACILICDITRPVPNHLFLRPVIERLMSAGVPGKAITVLVATGLHRPNLGDELRELIGDAWVLENVNVANHDARDDAAHVSLGETRARKVPVRLDRRFVEADLKIATGLVEPHFMAGYSGGRKVIAPGVAHHTTIRTFHSARFMEDPKASSCNLAGNPLHEEQLEIVAMLDDGVLALNTVIDEARNLIHASFGDVVASHLTTVAFVRDSIEVKVPRRFNTVVTTAAGYPLDKTYYQTVKGMVTPLDILEPGGTLIIASDCSEGVGSAEFRAAQQRLIELGPDAFLETLSGKRLADVDEWQTEMQLKPMRVGTIALYSQGLSDEDHALTGVDRVRDLSGAIRDSIERHADPAIAVVPEGPYVVPFFAA